VRRYANASTAGFAVGALGLAASIYLLTRPGPPTGSRQSRLPVEVQVVGRSTWAAVRVVW
jgi:hypothetical protein